MWANERTFQVKPEDPISVADGASSSDGASHLLARIADQRRQTGCRAVTTVGPRNGTHAISGRLVVEQNAAAPVDLQSMKPGARNAPDETRVCGQSAGISPQGPIPATRPSLTSTAASLCQQ